VNAPSGWSDITDYAAAGGPKPDRARAQQILEELVEAVAFSRCTYRPEVISAILRRAPLTIPAFGFGFRGAGESYETSGASPMPGFRSDDLVTIRHVQGLEDGEVEWNRTDGIARAADDALLVSLGPGDWVAYEFLVPSGSRFQIVVALMEGHALDISIDGEAVAVEDAVEGTVRGMTGRLSAGRHLVRLTGRLNETLVRSIEVNPS
jgi:hypothetical protein